MRVLNNLNSSISMKRISLLLLLIAACTSPSAQEDLFTFMATSLQEGQAAFSSRMVIGLPDADHLTPEAQRAMLGAAHRAAMPRFWEAYPQLEAAADPEVQDALARAVVSGTPEEGRWLIEQYVGQYMLETLLSTPESDADVVAHYVEMLHRNDSQRTDLLAGGLHRLQETWPRERVQAYAADGVARAERWLTRSGQAVAKRTPESLPPQHTNQQRVAHYLGELEELASR